MNKDCELCDSFLLIRCSSWSQPLIKQEKNPATPQLADPGYVQNLEEVNASLSDQKVATDQRKSTHPKESTKQKSSKLSSSSSSDEIKALNTKSSERFSRLEAMLMARTF